LPFSIYIGENWILIITQFQKDRGVNLKMLQYFIGKMISVSVSVPGSIVYLKSLCRAFYAVINNWAFFNDSCLFELDMWEEITR